MKTLVFIILFIVNISTFSAPINIGVLNFAPPFSSAVGKERHYGFVIDLMDTICERIHAECFYKSINSGEQFDELKRESIDVAFLPIPISSTVPEQFIYSLPYLTSNGQFLSSDDSKIKTVSDIKNAKIGVVVDTLYPVLASSNFAQFNTIKSYKTVTEMISGLHNHEVDLVYVNANVARYIINNAMFNFQYVGNKIAMGQGYGILALKKNADLIGQINNALLDMEADGTYLKIYNQYFSK